VRVGVVGAGIAGLTTAWLLDDEHEVVLLEAQSRLGGNAVSTRVELDGRELTLDVGAQHVSPELFPHHHRLLQLLGVDGPSLPARQSFTLQVAGESQPTLVTPHARNCPWPRETRVEGAVAEALGAFAAAAQELEASDASWEIPLAALVEPLPVAPALRESLLYGMAAAFVGCSLAEAPELSARGATAPLVRAPAGTAPDEAPVWRNLDGSLQRLVDALAGDLRRTTVRTGAPVHQLQAADEGFALRDGAGAGVFVDHVVLALPPSAAVELLGSLAGSEGLRRDLAAFRYADVEIGIHRDPRFVPPDRRHWSTYNVDVHDGWSDVCIWFGPTHGVDLFKSWIAHREVDDEQLLASAGFRHLGLTPAAVRARRRIADRQGCDGISLAGHHLVDVENQESAVVSAIEVARRLAPDGPRLARLRDLGRSATEAETSRSAGG
jgi:predicted NAD/FAD-binding protein